MIADKKETKTLSAVQGWMQQALILSGTTTSAKEIEAHVNASPTLQAADCLAIYQRSYYARLTQCLHEQYKALSYALGKELFTDFSKEYLKVYPSDSPTLSDLGARFPAFLHETRPDQDAAEKEPWVDFMIDLARFEWNLYVLFDAKGHEGKPYADESVADEQLELQICFSLSRYQFPVSEFYRAVAHEEAPEVPEAEPIFVAICRKDYQIRTFSLFAPQFFFLNRMLEEANVEKALTLTAERFEIPATEMKSAWQLWKKEWLKAGFFVAC